MNDILKADIIDVCASPYGFAIFLKAANKIFVVYVDRARGSAVESAFNKVDSERPLTHDFVCQMLDGLECTVENVLIYAEKDGTFFTRIAVDMQNELGQKIVEVDGRPSDTFPIALRVGAPIYISEKVLANLADVTEAYRMMKG